MNIEEIWKDIPGYEGFYQVSNLGRVKSLAREFIKTDGTYYRQSKDIPLKIYNKKGYCYVALYKDFTRKQFYLHRIVANAFIPGINGKLEVNHIDGNKSNNSSSNLEWCTKQENMDHAVVNKLRKNTARGQNIGTSKLKDNEVIDIYNNSNIKSVSELSEKYNVSKCAIRYILNGKYWGHITRDLPLR